MVVISNERNCKVQENYKAKIKDHTKLQVLLPDLSIYKVVCTITLYVGHSLIPCFLICHLEFSRKVCEIGYMFNDLCITLYVGHSLILCFLICHLEFRRKVCEIGYMFNDLCIILLVGRRLRLKILVFQPQF
jgi:hypothetical protein